MPEPLSHGSCLQKLPPAQLAPLCLNQLHRLVHFSAGESAADEIRCARSLRVRRS